MQKENGHQWVLAALYQGEYYPERITEIEELDNLEYRDVEQMEYQIWEWPSGDIYTIASDRRVAEEDAYSLPYGKNGIIWLPTLIKVANNQQKVADAIKKLSS
jgi:hypothetical protein